MLSLREWVDRPLLPLTVEAGYTPPPVAGNTLGENTTYPKEVEEWSGFSASALRPALSEWVQKQDGLVPSWQDPGEFASPEKESRSLEPVDSEHGVNSYLRDQLYVGVSRLLHDQIISAQNQGTQLPDVVWKDNPSNAGSSTNLTVHNRRLGRLVGDRVLVSRGTNRFSGHGNSSNAHPAREAHTNAAQNPKGLEQDTDLEGGEEEAKGSVLGLAARMHIEHKGPQALVKLYDDSRQTCLATLYKAGNIQAVRVLAQWFGYAVKYGCGLGGLCDGVVFVPIKVGVASSTLYVGQPLKLTDPEAKVRLLVCYMQDLALQWTPFPCEYSATCFGRSPIGYDKSPTPSPAASPAASTPGSNWKPPGADSRCKPSTIWRLDDPEGPDGGGTSGAGSGGSAIYTSDRVLRSAKTGGSQQQPSQTTANTTNRARHFDGLGGPTAAQLAALPTEQAVEAVLACREALKDVLPLNELHLGRALGSGISGIVREGSLAGGRVAVKTTQMGSRLLDLDSIINEIRCLQTLQHLQGRCVPVLVAHGWTWQGTTYFMATQVVEGPLLRDVRLSRQELMDMEPWAIQGLRDIHASGVLHADLRPQNIIATSSTTCIILDFGRSVISDAHNERALKYEVQELRRLLRNTSDLDSATG